MSESTLTPLESEIKSQLRQLGYFNIKINGEKTNDSFDVLADGNMRRIFLKVLIRFVNDKLKDLTKDEIVQIKSDALEVSKEPWAAIMYVNEIGQLVDTIRWKNLSKQVA